MNPSFYFLGVPGNGQPSRRRSLTRLKSQDLGTLSRGMFFFLVFKLSRLV